MDGYPAAATPEVVIALKEAASSLRKEFVSGIAASTDAFYAGQGRPSFKNYFPSQAKTLVSDLRAANVLCFEMESSTLFTLGRLFGVRTGALFAVLGNRMTDDFKADAGIDDAIEVAVEAVRRLKGFLEVDSRLGGSGRARTQSSRRRSLCTTRSRSSTCRGLGHGELGDLWNCYWAMNPPSATRMWPVTNDDSSDARKRATEAISSGLPNLPIGSICKSPFPISGCPATSLSTIGVLITPGAMALTLIPCFAYSSATVLVSCTIPPLEAQYALRPGEPTSPATDAVLIMLPPPLFSISGMQYFIPSHSPLRFIEISLSKTSSG